MAAPTLTEAAGINVEAIPAELRERDQWVGWRREAREKGPTKVLYQPRNHTRKAKTTDPATWSSLRVALATYDGLVRREPGVRLDGIGFVFSESDPFWGADFDGCLLDGELLDWARPHVERLARTYGDLSPSGNGIKFVGRGKLMIPSGRTGAKISGIAGPGTGIEFYHCRRFFTMTGNPWSDVDTIEDLSADVNAIITQLRPPKPPGPPRTSSKPSTLYDQELLDKARKAKNGPKFIRLYDRGDIADYAGDDSKADSALVSMLAFWTGDDPARIERLMNASALGTRDKWRDRADYRETTITNAVAALTTFYDPTRGRSKHPKHDAAPVNNGGQKQASVEVNTKRHIVVAESIRALTVDPGLYYRGESLVTVVQETTSEMKLTGRTSLKGIAGSPRVIDLAPQVVGCYLTRNASFYRMQTDKNGEPIAIDIHPPDWLIKAVATHKHWPRVRQLAAVVECPFPRPDGSIVETPGYDRETATLYLPTIEFPRVPDRPTKDDAIAAWDRLKTYVERFPFPTEDDRAIFLAGLMNVIGRPAVAGPVPGIVVNGNKAATGKGLLTDAMTIPGTGRPAPTSSYPDNKEEAVKVKVAIVWSGKPVVCFDNLEEGSSYGGSALDSMLTSLTIDDRLLGFSKQTGEIPVRVAVFANGNNISPTKDAWRRWLVANLTTDLEHPEQRTDLGNTPLRTRILENRGAIVRDVLTIFKAHALDGYPTGKWAPMGSFEDWDRVVRGAVWYATERDCLATQQQTADDAPDRQAKIALLQGWRELKHGKPPEKGGIVGVTAAEAVKLVKDSPTSYETLHTVLIQHGRGGELASPQRLGHILRGLKNTPTGGYKLKASPTLKHGVICWYVECNETNDPTKQSSKPQEDHGGDDGDGGDDPATPRGGVDPHTDVITSRGVCEPSLNGASGRPPSPSSPPKPWQDTLASWPADHREQWEQRFAELKASGLGWREAETQAFREIAHEQSATDSR